MLRGAKSRTRRRIKSEANTAAVSQREASAAIYEAHPSLLRLHELETLRELAHNGNARIYIGFPKHLGEKE